MARIAFGLSIFVSVQTKAQSVKMAPYVPSAFDLIEFFFEPFELYAETDIPNFVFLDFRGDEWRVRPIGSRAFDSGEELGIAFRETSSLKVECRENWLEQVVDYYNSAYHVFRLRIKHFGCDFTKLTRKELVNFNFEKLEDQKRFELDFGRFVFPDLAAADDMVVDMVFEAQVDVKGISEVRIPWLRSYARLSMVGRDLEYEFGDFDGGVEGRFTFAPRATSDSYSLLIVNGDGMRVDPVVPIQIFSYLESNFRQEGDYFLNKFRYFYDILKPESSENEGSSPGNSHGTATISSGL